MTEQQPQMGHSTAAFNGFTNLPDNNKTSKKDKTEKGFYVTIRNARTGYTKLVDRFKAYRMVNNMPSLWSIVNRQHSFKDTFEVA